MVSTYLILSATPQDMDQYRIEFRQVFPVGDEYETNTVSPAAMIRSVKGERSWETFGFQHGLTTASERYQSSLRLGLAGSPADFGAWRS